MQEKSSFGRACGNPSQIGQDSLLVVQESLQIVLESLLVVLEFCAGPSPGRTNFTVYLSHVRIETGMPH